MGTLHQIAFLGMLSVLLAGCSADNELRPGPRCQGNQDCPGGLICAQSLCVEPAGQVGQPCFIQITNNAPCNACIDSTCSAVCNSCMNNADCPAFAGCSLQCGEDQACRDSCFRPRLTADAT